LRISLRYFSYDEVKRKEKKKERNNTQTMLRALARKQKPLLLGPTSSRALDLKRPKGLLTRSATTDISAENTASLAMVMTQLSFPPFGE
jgi:hypothetical protein